MNSDALKHRPSSLAVATSCKIIRGGQLYFDRLLSIIEASQEVLHLQVYIFNNDETGILVQEALIRARQRGVRIFLVLDGIGSGHLPKKFLYRFLEAGIELRFFSKVHFRIPLRMGRRLHHKLLVADQRVALVGGINIADRYRGNAQQQAWLDYAVYLEGPICIQLQHIALKIVRKRKIQPLLASKVVASSTQGESRTQVLVNDFFDNNLQIRKSYYQAVRNAQSTILIFASYFLPSIRLMRLLEKASARGVQISLVLPQKTDVLFYPMAVKYLYRRLLRKGIQIYEYTPSILHAKVAVVDRQWCTIGSYNLNDLSDLLSIEMNIELTDKRLATTFQQDLWAVIEKDCISVRGEQYMQAAVWLRLLWLIYYYGILQSIKLLYWLTDKKKDYPISAFGKN